MLNNATEDKAAAVHLDKAKAMYDCITTTVKQLKREYVGAYCNYYVTFCVNYAIVLHHFMKHKYIL